MQITHMNLKHTCFGFIYVLFAHGIRKEIGLLVDFQRNSVLYLELGATNYLLYIPDH